MNRLENIHIQDRPVTMALFHYDDHFYDTALRKYSFKEALHMYLKKNGFDTIVFFSTGNGIHSFEKEMLEVFLKTDNDTLANNQTSQQVFQPRRGRHGGSGFFEIKPQEQEHHNLSVLVKKSDGIWRDIQHNLTRDAQIAQINYNLRNRKNCAIIVEPSQVDAEFTTIPPQKQLITLLTDSLDFAQVREDNNHFIVLGHTEIAKGYCLPEYINPSGSGTKSDFWRTPYFQQQFFDDEKDERGVPVYSLSGVDKSDGSVFVMPEPTGNDIKNAFQYWRIVNSRSWKIEWSEVESIVSQLSTKRGEKDKLMTHSLDQWEKTFKATDVISIDALETFGVHKVDDSKIVKFDKERLIKDLKAVKGQQDNMEVVVEAINTWIRKKKKAKPIVFMFAGTSGTGKTFTAQNIQKSLAEDGYNFVRLDMGEYKSEGDNWKLLGSPRGYSGSTTDAPLFAERKKSDKLVILFDEIEKAHPSLFTTIMSLMDEGGLADGKGENYDFRQSVIIFTTNLAMDRLHETKKQLKVAGVKVTSNEFQESTKKILKESGLPNEICGRIDWLLVYNALGASDIVQIALEQIRKTASEEYDLSINLVSTVYLRMVAEQCSGSNEGARPLRREISTTIEPILSAAHDSGRYSPKRLYDINDEMQIVESVQSELVENVVINVEPTKIVKFDKERLIKDLKAVKGQQDNMEVVVEAINTWIRKKKKAKPIVFMFAGTSGTGKTFTAQNIQKSLAEDGYKYVRLDMSEYSSPYDTWKLLGSSKGHLGSDTDTPIFAARKMSDKLVILFDEIEKAHPSLFTTIMSLMDEGALADGKGENYDFRQSVIIFTTNLAMDRLLETKKALMAENTQIISNKFQESTKKILKESGLPNEICGRIDWLLVYNALGASDIVQIALEQIRKKGEEYGLKINLVSENYLIMLAEQCSGSNEGARPVRREIDKTIEPKLQDAYESGTISLDKLYDINDDMEIVESASTELVD